MIDIPHFSFPFRLSGGSPATVEQGSDDEILDCVEVLLSTEPGERIDLPDYGLEDQTFREGGASRTAIQNTIRTWEPRASTDIEPAELEERIDNVRLNYRSARGD